jgi:hypothetical protein
MKLIDVLHEELNNHTLHTPLRSDLHTGPGMQILPYFHRVSALKLENSYKKHFHYLRSTIYDRFDDPRS